ncbi:ATP-binding protein [Azospira sp. I09]|jgi:hypothetical protein|uniref:ATP-binding protein n=1 Tax=Azospira sp. I09 TaxID=1765049 RepID=UPI001260FC69|nr:ATP-binding protein [Azospira sp. I09]
MMANFMNSAVACYTEQGPSAYRGNPLIEALPPIRTHKEVLDYFKYLPDLNIEEDLKLPLEQRLQCVFDIDDVIIPSPAVFEVEEGLSAMLRRGYLSRSPYDPGFRRTALNVRKALSTAPPPPKHFSKTTLSMLVTGVSGCGKTTLVERLLEAYPQVIDHRRYKGHSLPLKQLVWIKVNASFDASLRGLILSIFEAIDDALGTEYRQQYERAKATNDSLIGVLGQVFMTHYLGVLFVDEIQCLLLRGKDEAKLALNFFLKIGNVCKVPIIFSGTYAAVTLFSSVARNARRACSAGYHDLKLVEDATDPFWNQWYLGVLWKRYQWVPKPLPLSPEISSEMFNLTQGIMAIVVALHRACQIYAIRNGLESVDIETIKKVYDEQFVMLHKALAALRSKSRAHLEQFEDLLPPKEQLKMLLSPSTSDVLIQRLTEMRQQLLEESSI